MTMTMCTTNSLCWAMAGYRSIAETTCEGL